MILNQIGLSKNRASSPQYIFREKKQYLIHKIMIILEKATNGVPAKIRHLPHKYAIMLDLGGIYPIIESHKREVPPIPICHTEK
jgi:hypothetical protein